MNNKTIKRSDLLKLKQLHDFLVQNNIEIRGNDVYFTFNASQRHTNKERIHAFDFDIGIVSGHDPVLFEKEQIQPHQLNGWYIKNNKLKQY